MSDSTAITIPQSTVDSINTEHRGATERYIRKQLNVDPYKQRFWWQHFDKGPEASLDHRFKGGAI